LQLFNKIDFLIKQPPPGGQGRDLNLILILILNLSKGWKFYNKPLGHWQNKNGTFTLLNNNLMSKSRLELAIPTYKVGVLPTKLLWL
jgi:hypothetical protein